MTQTFSGSVELTDAEGRTTLTLDGEGGSLTVGGNGASGTLSLKSSADDDSIRLDADRCRIEMGGAQPGRISLHDSLDRRTVHLDGATGYAHLKGLIGRVHVGGRGEDGHLYLTNRDGEATVRLESTGHAGLGGRGQYGSLYLRDSDGRKRVALHGHVGELVLFGERGEESVRLNGETGNVHLGGEGRDGDLFLQNQAGETTIHLDGETGVIHVPNADCAEDFPVADAAPAGEALEAGDVVVFDEDSALVRSGRAYDRRVAGVISGAGDSRPGIVLGRDPSRRDPERRGRLPVALVGKVHCKVDADHGAIEVGDLLTTSPRPGHAMKAGDPARAFGAVLGKALQGLRQGQGTIPILVALR